MSTYMKPGMPWLYDSTTGDIVGVKDADGGETMFVKWNPTGTAPLDPTTGVAIDYLSTPGKVPNGMSWLADTISRFDPYALGFVKTPTIFFDPSASTSNWCDFV